MNRQITVKIPLMKITSYHSKETNPFPASNNNVQVSPVLAFDSGPGFELRPLIEPDLKNLPNVDSTELDSSLRDLLLEKMKSVNVFTDDNDDTVSEVSTCSSVVALETVDESDTANTTSAPTGNRKTSSASSFNAGSTSRTTEGASYHSLSEAEEEDGRKTAIKKSKKISDLFPFNASNLSGNGVNEENDEIRPPVPSERRRKLSITKRISPLSLHGIFAGSQSIGANKQEATNEKETKRTRKLSLTMFHKPASEKERKRRNTDPQLPPNQQVTTTIENEEKRRVEETVNLERKESQTKPVPEQAFFKEEDVKLHDLIKHVLRAHLLSMKEYKREKCDRVCKSICKILKTLVESMKETENVQCKVVCQAYIGSVRDEGMFASVQALWENDRDNFAAASFRSDSLFGFASVITNSLY